MCFVLREGADYPGGAGSVDAAWASVPDRYTYAVHTDVGDLAAVISTARSHVDGEPPSR